MRAMGPGSVSSFLKIILDVVFAALWIGIGILAVAALVTLVISANPDLVSQIRLSTEGDIGKLLDNGPGVVRTLGPAAL